MEGVILTKTNEIPADAVAAMFPACKVKLIEQLQLVRTPELDAFGHTAIENKDGATSVELYIQGALAGHCSDHFLSSDADGRPLALISGILQDDGTFITLVSLHNTDAQGSTSYVYSDDFVDEALIEQYVALGCDRWEIRTNIGTPHPAYLSDQGFIEVTGPDDNYRTLQGPFGW